MVFRIVDQWGWTLNGLAEKVVRHILTGFIRKDHRFIIIWIFTFFQFPTQRTDFQSEVFFGNRGPAGSNLFVRKNQLIKVERFFSLLIKPAFKTISVSNRTGHDTLR